MPRTGGSSYAMLAPPPTRGKLVRPSTFDALAAAPPLLCPLICTWSGQLPPHPFLVQCTRVRRARRLGASDSKVPYCPIRPTPRRARSEGHGLVERVSAGVRCSRSLTFGPRRFEPTWLRMEGCRERALA